MFCMLVNFHIKVITYTCFFRIVNIFVKFFYMRSDFFGFSFKQLRKHIFNV